MNVNDSILEREYKINTLNINTNKKLGLVGLLGILQDISVEHALKLGFGYENSLKKGFFWVLVRQKLRIIEWPNWNDLVLVKTWTKPVLGIYAIREYEIFVNDQKMAECSTTWMILDNNTRKPKKIENSDNLFRPRTDYSLDFSADKVIIPANTSPIKSFEVRISDLDLNNHANNIRYTQWILDSIPLVYHKKFMIKEYDINFSDETFLGDRVETFSTIEKSHSNNNQEIYFKIIRVKDSKTICSARILARELGKMT